MSSLLRLRPLLLDKPSTRRRNEFNESTCMLVIAWNRGKAQGKWVSMWRSSRPRSLVPTCMNGEVSPDTN